MMRQHQVFRNDCTAGVNGTQSCQAFLTDIGEVTRFRPKLIHQQPDVFRLSKEDRVSLSLLIMQPAASVSLHHIKTA